MTTEILVDFESKKEPIATWIEALTGLPHDNIRGADQTGKIQYPACVINEIIEIDTHRPLRRVEEIDGELKHVVYASRKVMLDVAFITRTDGDYGSKPSDRLQNASYYMTLFQGSLYLPEESIEYLSTNGLSILSAAAPRRDDTRRNTGWQRKRIIELGLGYVHQSSEPVQTIESISGVKGAVYALDQKIIIEMSVGPYQLLEEKGQPDGYAELDSSGLVPASQLPDLIKIRVFIVFSEVEQLALTVKEGDLCVRKDAPKRTYIALNADNNSLADWQEAYASPDAADITQDALHRFVTDALIATWNNKQDGLGYTPEDAANKAAVNGYASLGADGKVPQSQIPSVVLNDIYDANSEAEQLALTVQKSDLCNRHDEGETYIALNDNNLSMSDWKSFLHPASQVTSVDGEVGAVVLSGVYAALAHTQAASTIIEDSSRRFVTDSDKTNWNGKADDSAVVHNTGAESVAGEKTFTEKINVDEISIDGDEITNNQTNGDIKVVPAGTGGIGNLADLTGKKIAFEWKGAETLDQSFTNAFTSAASAVSWQSFTPSAGGYLNKIDVKVNGNRTSVVFRIYEGEGTAGQLLLQKLIGPITTGETQVEFDPIPVIGNELYTIYMDMTPQSSAWAYNTSGGYPNGRSAISPTSDHFFRTYMLDNYLLFVGEYTSNRWGLNVAAPTATLDVGGDVRARGNIKADGDITQRVHIDNVSNPPTDAELDAFFGTPATVGAGFTAYIDDQGGSANFYQITSDGTSWWIFTGIKAV